MSHTNHPRTKELFWDTLQRPVPQRLDFLREACGSDVGLRAEVQSLLTAYDEAPSSLERPLLNLEKLSSEGSGPAAEPFGLNLAGTRLGAYRLVSCLGAGGMGIVWQGERADGLHDRTVAVKIVNDPGSRAGWHRFVKEQATLASLDHPYIAKLLDAGMMDLGLPYFVMEFVAGQRIDVYCDKHRLSIGERLQLFVKVCEAVQFAHRKLVVHRDLKPGNILVDGEGVPKLLDFGIAKLLSDDAGIRPSNTQTEGRSFTPEYASPEQIRGEPPTTATDVFSLGVVLYELLTGQRFRPFQPSAAVNFDAWMTHEVEKPSRAILKLPETGDGNVSQPETAANAVAAARGGSLERIRKCLSGDVDMIVLTALRHEPARRYSTVEQFAEDIRRHLNHQPVSARPDTWRYRARKFVRRNRAVVAAGVIGILGLVTTTIGTSVGLARAVKAQQEAEMQASIRMAVNDFYNIQMLGAVKPIISKGRDLTIREVLDMVAENIPGKYPNQPLAEAVIETTVAQLYKELNELGKAEAHGVAGLALYRKHAGNDNQLTLRALNSLGVILQTASRYAEAEPLLLEALDRRRRAFGEEHHDTMTSLNNVATLYVLQNRTSEALPLFQKCCELRARLSGAEHKDTLMCLSNLSYLYQQVGRIDEAQQLGAQLLDTSRRVRGEDDVITLSVMSNLASYLLDLKRAPEAEALLVPALEARRRIMGPAHTETLNTLQHLARALADTERLAAAAEMYETFFELAPGNLPARHHLWGTAKGHYARCLSKLDRFDEAETMLLEGYEHLRNTVGDANPKTRRLVRALADFYASREQPELAAKWQSDQPPP